MQIIIPSGIHVHSHSDPVWDYLHRACPLHQLVVFRQAEKIAFKHTMNLHSILK